MKLQCTAFVATQNEIKPQLRKSNRIYDYFVSDYAIQAFAGILRLRIRGDYRLNDALSSHSVVHSECANLRVCHRSDTCRT
jgi:hypothetical protein